MMTVDWFLVVATLLVGLVVLLLFRKKWSEKTGLEELPQLKKADVGKTKHEAAEEKAVEPTEEEEKTEIDRPTELATEIIKSSAKKTETFSEGSPPVPKALEEKAVEPKEEEEKTQIDRPTELGTEIIKISAEKTFSSPVPKAPKEKDAEKEGEEEEKTRVKLIKSLLENAQKVTESYPPVYKVCLSDHKHQTEGKYKMYEFGEQKSLNERHVVFMVVGPSGAGKSTVINFMMNYMLKVDWADDYRFQMISDRGTTQVVTCYTIHVRKGMNLEWTMTIVDTPEFGGTKSIAKDKLILEQIRAFFADFDKHHVDHIDGIGFVAQAFQAELTPTQKFVYDSILTIFGKDIGNNIIPLVTFADKEHPVPFDIFKGEGLVFNNNIFTFNNTALLAKKTIVTDSPAANKSVDIEEAGDDDYSAPWDTGCKSVKALFSSLENSRPQSVSLTKEVLEERERLEPTVEDLQHQIQIGCRKLEELRKEQRILEECERDIEANKNFEYDIITEKMRKIDIESGKFVTNCSTCQFTCHYPCKLPNNEDKFRCWAMNDGSCTQCPGRCIWNIHSNNPYRIEYYEEKERRSYAMLEKRYNEATGMNLSVAQVIKKHQEEFILVKECVFHLIAESYKSLKRLEEIALKQDPLSAVEYVDLLIASEKKETKQGWDDRVKALGAVRQEAHLMGKVTKSNYDPFEKYRKEFLGKEKYDESKSPYAIWKN